METNAPNEDMEEALPSIDEELDAMQKVAEALDLLPSRARIRVLSWTVNRYDYHLDGSSQTTQKRAVAQKHNPSTPQEDTQEMPETFAELYHAADPQTEADKVLLAAYWLQEHEGEEGLYSQDVNDKLKHLGFPVSNMTREFGKLMDRKPQLAMQIRKEGSTRQARKVYKITHSGLRAVKEMLGGTDEGS